MAVLTIEYSCSTDSGCTLGLREVLTYTRYNLKPGHYKLGLADLPLQRFIPLEQRINVRNAV